MNRKSFIKNTLMALAVSLLPKVLRPMDSEIIEEENEPDFFRNFAMLIPESCTVTYKPTEDELKGFKDLKPNQSWGYETYNYFLFERKKYKQSTI